MDPQGDVALEDPVPGAIQRPLGRHYHLLVEPESGVERLHEALEAIDRGTGHGAAQSNGSRDPGSRARGRADCCMADRKSTRLNSSHGYISYAVFCLKKKKNRTTQMP